MREVHHPYFNKRQKIDQNLPEDVLLPNIDQSHRVPDLLHMVKNVTKFFLKNSAKELYPNGPETARKKWVDQLILPYKKFARKHSNESRTVSTHSAFWNFMLGRPGWRQIKNLTNDGFENLRIVKIKSKLPDGSIFYDEFKTKDVILNIFVNYYYIFDCITHATTNHHSLETIQRGLDFIREAVISLKWELTPWAHTFLEHILEFEKCPVRPIQLTSHSLEGSHKITKNYFS